MKTTSPFLLLLIPLALLTQSCTKTLSSTPQTEYVMGTFCTVNLFENESPKLHTEIFDRLRELEDILSANKENTNVSEINTAAGIFPVHAEKETLEILKIALEFSTSTNGAFDPSIGPLVKTWGIGTNEAAVPSLEKITKALSLVDYTKIEISDNTIFLPQKGMQLDLGAIAKGYAADEIVKILTKHNIKRAIIDLGGNVFAHGKKTRTKPWTIGIRDPEVASGNPVLSVSIENKSVVTSGIYQRNFMENGKTYHHILDPKTGFPAENDLLAVTIISSSSILADALSTSAFLLGLEKGLHLIEATKNTEALFITKNKDVFVTRGLQGQLNIINTQYTIKN